MPEPDLHKWALAILNTPIEDRAAMVAEDPTVLDVINQAYQELRNIGENLAQIISDEAARPRTDTNTRQWLNHVVTTTRAILAQGQPRRMPPTDDKGRFVAIKLGLWHEGPNIINKEGLRGAGAPPPPDFLSPAGADLLLRTLLDKGWQITAIFKVVASVHVFLATPDGEVEEGIGATWPEALLDAAYKLVKALEEK